MMARWLAVAGSVLKVIMTAKLHKYRDSTVLHALTT
jgi:hypothetical protein